MLKENIKNLTGFVIFGVLLLASCGNPPPIQRLTPTRSPVTPTPTLTPIIPEEYPLTKESVVFQSFRNEEEAIYLMGGNGFGQTRLVNGVDPAWSPNGVYLAYSQVSDDRDMIFLMKRRSPDVVQLTSGFTPAWSPDGRQLVFSDIHEGNVDIFLIDLESSARRQITSDPADELNPNWSPDGRRIAFERNGQIVITNLADNQQTMLGDGSSIDTTPAWSPDGLLIAISSRPNDTNGNSQIDYNDNSYITLMNADGTNRTVIITPPENQGQAAWSQSPAWSEDGMRLVFESNQSGQWDIWVVNKDGSAAENLTGSVPGSVNLNPQWRPPSD